MTQEEINDSECIYNNKSQLSIGDLIVVDNHGGVYITYDIKFERFGFKDKKENYYGLEFINLFVIFNIEENLISIRNLFNQNYELLIDKRCLKKVDKNKINIDSTEFLNTFPCLLSTLKDKLLEELNNKK